MNEPKKTEVVTFRTTKEIKTFLDEMAKLNQWSVAQLVHAIIHNYIADDKPNSIVVNANDFYNYVKRTEETMEANALEISIYYYKNDENVTEKHICIDRLVSGGNGLISNDESLESMSREEILDIP